MSKPYWPSSGKLRVLDVRQRMRVDLESIKCSRRSEKENARNKRQLVKRTAESGFICLPNIKRDRVIDDAVLYIFRQFLLFDAILVQRCHKIGERSWHPELQLHQTTRKYQWTLQNHSYIQLLWQFWWIFVHNLLFTWCVTGTRPNSRVAFVGPHSPLAQSGSGTITVCNSSQQICVCSR